MKRAEFIRTCSMGCIGLLSASALLSGCSTTSFVPVSSDGDYLKLPKTSFLKENGGFKRFVLIKSNELDYPVVVYTDKNDEYNALLLKCTHQGTQLTVHGDLISCPSHGSEFAKNGAVISGPASRGLQRFSVKSDQDHLLIKIS